MMIKVSVIVPVYNVEPCLRRCLDSLINQTLRDIEIICINDCSPDKSLVILKEYAKKDERVKVIDFEKNQGVSVARNSGMKIAKGEYIGFCDSDDYVDLDFYEKLYELAKEKNADIVKGVWKVTKIGTNKELITNFNELILKHKGYFIYQFYTAIYRNKMLKKYKVKFPVGKILGQDVCFSSYAGIVAKNIYVLNNVFYNYVVRGDSSTGNTYSCKKMYSAIKCRSIVLDRLDKAAKKNKNYINVYINVYIQFIQEFLFYLSAKNSEKRVARKIAKTAITYYQKYKFPKNLDLDKSIITAIRNKNEKRLVWLLQNWTKGGKLITDDFYPLINIKKNTLQNRRLYIWGTGEDGIRVKKQCESYGWEITAFLDSNKSIKKYYEYKVVSPEQILNRPEKDFFIIISSRKYAKDIAETCRNAGLKIGKDFWRPS